MAEPTFPKFKVKTHDPFKLARKKMNKRNRTVNAKAARIKEKFDNRKEDYYDKPPSSS